jgi:hypothetical protein
LLWLENEWDKLRQIEFQVKPLEMSKFTEVIKEQSILL